MVMILEKAVLRSLVPPACYIEDGGIRRQLDLLGFTTPENRRSATQLRYKLKKERNLNYENFLKRCKLHKIGCPDDNTWLDIVQNKDDEEEEEEEGEVDKRRVSSEKMNKPKMITNGGDRDSGDHHSFVIDLNRLEQSFPGYSVYYHSQVKSPSGEFKCDFMEIQKFMYDPRDAMSIMTDTVVKAELMEDGSGILVTEPMLPKYVVSNRTTIENITGDWNEEKSTDYIDKMEKYEKNIRNYRYTRIFFPPGVIGTTENIRGNQNGREATALEMHQKIVPFWDPVPQYGMMQVIVQYVCWNIEVKGTVKKMKFQTDDASLNTLLMTMANLGHMKSLPGPPQQMSSPAPQQSMNLNQNGQQQGFFASPAAQQLYTNQTGHHMNQNGQQQGFIASPTAYQSILNPSQFGFAMSPTASQQTNNNGQIGFVAPLSAQSMNYPTNFNGQSGFGTPLPAQLTNNPMDSNGQVGSVVPFPAQSNDQAGQNAFPNVANVGFYYPSTSTVIFLPPNNPDAIAEYGPLLAQYDPWNFTSIEMASPHLIGTKRPILEPESSTSSIVEAATNVVEAPTTQQRIKRRCLDQTSKDEVDDINFYSVQTYD